MPKKGSSKKKKSDLLSLDELEHCVTMSQVMKGKFLIELKLNGNIYRCRSEEQVVFDCLDEKKGNILTRQEALQSAYNECKAKNKL